ncbi:MAG: hypothetical protein WAW09_11400 [Smithella sp.]
MNSYTSQFIDRILIHNHTKWWENLNSETNKNKGRCLQSTLEQELSDIAGYRKEDRRLFFFSNHSASSIDGRFKSVGVEEKYNPLDIEEHLIDGSIHRGVVWVLGNPQNLAPPVESISVYVVQGNSPPIPFHIVDLYFPILFALFKLGIHLVFINGKTGEFWKLHNGDIQKPLPKWLAAKESPIIWDRKIDIVTMKNQKALEVINDQNELQKKNKLLKTLPGFGKKGEYVEVEIDNYSKAAIIDYGNEWRLIELGLILRSAGYDAVKTVYNKAKHKNKIDQTKDKLAAGRGVEKKIAEEMLSRFSVVIDWCSKI